MKTDLDLVELGAIDPRCETIVGQWRASADALPWTFLGIRYEDEETARHMAFLFETTLSIYPEPMLLEYTDTGSAWLRWKTNPVPIIEFDDLAVDDFNKATEGIRDREGCCILIYGYPDHTGKTVLGLHIVMMFGLDLHTGRITSSEKF